MYEDRLDPWVMMDPEERKEPGNKKMDPNHHKYEPPDPYKFARMEHLVMKDPLPVRRLCPCRVDKGPVYSFPADHVCTVIPAPAIAGGPYEDTEALLITGPGPRRGTIRVRGPPGITARERPGRPELPPKYMLYGSTPPWYLMTAEGVAEKWHEFKGLRVTTLPTMLTVPSIPRLEREIITVEFTLGHQATTDAQGAGPPGTLMDPLLSEAGDENELRGMRVILEPPEGYELICDMQRCVSHSGVDFEEVGECQISREGFAVVTLADTRIHRGDYALCLRATMPPTTPEMNDFVLRVETLDEVGVGNSRMRAPNIVDFILERPRFKWMYEVYPGAMPVSVSCQAPEPIVLRTLSSILITLPPDFVHRIFEPENIDAPNIPYDRYDLDVSDPRRVRLILIKEAFLEGLLKIAFEVSVPDRIPQGENVWKLSFLTDFQEVASFALPGFEMGDMPSDWQPAAAYTAPLIALALLFT
jgi:hypothetical protein